jgi:DNA polymerase-3 subunit epsilon
MISLIRTDEIFSLVNTKEKVDTILERNQVISWIQNADFPLYTKKVLTAIKLKN